MGQVGRVGLHQLSLKQFPAHERFELGAQTRRAAFSVAANIVEGFAHSPGRSRLNFLRIGHASLAEVGYCVHVAQRLGYLSDDVANELDVEIKRVGAPLAGLIRAARLRAAVSISATIVAIGALLVHLS